MRLTAHMAGPVTHSWRISWAVGLSGSEFAFLVGGLVEIQMTLPMTLPFSVMHDLCLGWVTLSFHGESGLVCAWELASLMRRTMGFRKKEFQKPGKI